MTGRLIDLLWCRGCHYRRGKTGAVLTGIHLKSVTFLQMYYSWNTPFQWLPPPCHVFVLYSAMFSSLTVIIHYKGLQSTVTWLHYDEVGLFQLSQLDDPNVRQIHLCRCKAAVCFFFLNETPLHFSVQRICREMRFKR